MVEQSALAPEQGADAGDIDELLATLPATIRQAIEAEDDFGSLLEIVLDLGRRPSARYQDREVELTDSEITTEELEGVVRQLGDFGDDNRAGIARTLHRISCLRNRRRKIVGLTMRVGRAVTGSVALIDDFVSAGASILLLGRPGVGKTTLLREVARVLAEQGKRVVIVDTSNEIAGDGDIPHDGIGRARRMQVETPERQHAVMVEAVENHMPEVIVIDEIGTELEALAARTIAERGVQLVATAHGNTLANLMLNPTLADLIGGIQTVTLSDDEARRRGTRKSVLERKAPPTFNALVEIQSFNRVAVQGDVGSTVDALLHGETVEPRSARSTTSSRCTRAPAHSRQCPGNAARRRPLRSSPPRCSAASATADARSSCGDACSDVRSRPSRPPIGASSPSASPVHGCAKRSARAAPTPRSWTASKTPTW